MDNIKLSAKQKEITELFRKHNLELTWYQTIPEDKQNVFWYGGKLAEITNLEDHNGTKSHIIISAAGDVEGDLLRDGETIDSFKDRSQEGYRRDTEYLLHNDDELETALAGERQYKLDLDYNNWIEYLFDRTFSDGTTESDVFSSVVSDADDILDELSDPYIFVTWTNDILDMPR